MTSLLFSYLTFFLRLFKLFGTWVRTILTEQRTICSQLCPYCNCIKDLFPTHEISHFCNTLCLFFELHFNRIIILLLSDFAATAQSCALKTDLQILIIDRQTQDKIDGRWYLLTLNVWEGKGQAKVMFCFK